jgi:hypothetical protein
MTPLQRVKALARRLGWWREHTTGLNEGWTVLPVTLYGSRLDGVTIHPPGGDLEYRFEKHDAVTAQLVLHVASLGREVFAGPCRECKGTGHWVEPGPFVDPVMVKRTRQHLLSLVGPDRLPERHGLGELPSGASVLLEGCPSCARPVDKPGFVIHGKERSDGLRRVDLGALVCEASPRLAEQIYSSPGQRAWSHVEPGDPKVVPYLAAAIVSLELPLGDKERRPRPVTRAERTMVRCRWCSRPPDFEFHGWVACRDHVERLGKRHPEPSEVSVVRDQLCAAGCEHDPVLGYLDAPAESVLEACKLAPPVGPVEAVLRLWLDALLGDGKPCSKCGSRTRVAESFSGDEVVERACTDCGETGAAWAQAVLALERAG